MGNRERWSRPPDKSRANPTRRSWRDLMFPADYCASVGCCTAAQATSTAAEREAEVSTVTASARERRRSGVLRPRRDRRQRRRRHAGAALRSACRRPPGPPCIAARRGCSTWRPRPAPRRRVPRRRSTTRRGSPTRPGRARRRCVRAALRRYVGSSPASRGPHRGRPVRAPAGRGRRAPCARRRNAARTTRCDAPDLRRAWSCRYRARRRRAPP